MKRKKLSFWNKKVKAFNLQEMLIVLAIIGVLLLIALPNFLPLIVRAKGQEAKIQLKYIYNLQTQHKYLNSKFSNDLTELDFEIPKTVKENGTANYSYDITEASEAVFKARATAVVDFDGDGVYNVWEIDHEGKPKQVVKD